MKVGEKEFTAKITNRVIWDIEEVFDKEISQVINGIGEMKTKDLGMLIYQGIKSDISFDDFADNIELKQYIPAAQEVVGEISKAFGLSKKK